MSDAAPERMVTMKDVARLAGVSPATVSRVLNGHDTKPQIGEAVRRAVAQLGYRPNLIARGLRKQVANVWALVISDIENQFFTALVRGVEDVARASDAAVVLCNTDEDLDKESDYLRMIAAQRMAGVIISATSRILTDTSSLEAAGVQVVAIDRELGRARDTVMVNSATGAQAATAHLIEAGCRRIACITGDRDTTTGSERLIGYQNALRAAGVIEDPQLGAYCDFRERSAYEAANRLIALSDPPDGFFVANNQMTIGVLRALSEAGLVVPTDVAVAGFDDMAWWSMSHPTVTAVRQPTYEMGRAAATMLVERLAGFREPARTLRFEPELIVRESSQFGVPLGISAPRWSTGAGRK